jgi:hypothetical protein
MYVAQLPIAVTLAHRTPPGGGPILLSLLCGGALACALPNRGHSLVAVPLWFLLRTTPLLALTAAGLAFAALGRAGVGAWEACARARRGAGPPRPTLFDVGGVVLQAGAAVVLAALHR